MCDSTTAAATDDPRLKHYPPAEERINIASHAVGLLLSIVGLLALVSRARFREMALETGRRVKASFPARAAHLIRRAQSGS